MSQIPANVLAAITALDSEPTAFVGGNALSASDFAFDTKASLWHLKGDPTKNEFIIIGQLVNDGAHLGPYGNMYFADVRIS